jgi:hypothetical protein
MSSRISLDTTSLTIRDVFCLNRNADVIQPISIPVAGANGKLQWLSSVEFLSTISIPTTSTSLFNYITYLGQEAISNFSTLSTNINIVRINLSTVGSNLSAFENVYNISTPIIVNSTITGLGSIPNGHDYLSSSALTYQFQNLATNYGYVSTVNPGAYRIYKSSLGLQGPNASTIMLNGANISSGTIGLQGFSSKAVSTSYMRIDVNANIALVYPTQLPSLTTFSTILVNPSNSQIIGDPVSLTFNASNANIANLSFLLNPTNLTPFPSTLQIRHVLNTGDSLNIITNIPQIGGIFVTLDNTD